MANLVVYKANELVVSRYDLTEQETRLILCAIGKLNPMIEKPTKKDRTVSITCAEFASEMGISIDLAWHNLNNAVSVLMNRSIEIINPDPRADVVKIIFQWVNYAEFNIRTQAVDLVFSDEIQPYLFNMKNFISYKLKNINSLNNRYSIKLYEWLLQEIGKSKLKEKVVSVSLDFFKRLLDLEFNYPVYKEFSRTVLKPIVKDVNDNSDLKVSVKTQGRPVDTLIFSVEKKQGVQLDLVDEVAKQEKAEQKAKPKRKKGQDEMTYEKLLQLREHYEQGRATIDEKSVKLMKSMLKLYEQTRSFQTATDKQMDWVHSLIATYRP